MTVNEAKKELDKFVRLKTTMRPTFADVLLDFGTWIPCSERLPEDEEYVLCCTVTKKGTKNRVIGYYAEGRWCVGMNSNVIAWMPLPEVYDETD